MTISLKPARDKMDKLSIKMKEIEARARIIRQKLGSAQKAAYLNPYSWAVAMVVAALSFYGTAGHNPALIFGDDPSTMFGLRKRKPGEAPK